MTDDDFVFGEEDEDSPRFGTRSDDTVESEVDRRFGTTDDTGSRSAVRGFRGPVRTAATVALALIVVASLGAVAYPLVVGSLGGTGQPGDGAGVPTDSDVTSPTATVTLPPTETTTEPARATTVAADETTAVVTPTTRPPSDTPTPTERTTTAAPRRGFPAGEPLENESNTSAN